MSFCEYCGNPKHNKEKGVCKDLGCYWYSHWKVDKSNPESVAKEEEIISDIKEMNW